MFRRQLLTKTLYLTPIMLLLILLPVSASKASPPVQLPDAVADHMHIKARLRNPVTGEEFDFEPVLIAAEQVPTGQGDDSTYNVQYAVGIPDSFFADQTTGQTALLPQLQLLPDQAYADSVTHGGYDSSYGVYANVEMLFHEGSYGGVTWMYIDQGKGTWTLDDYSISWSLALVQAACHSNWYSGGYGAACEYDSGTDGYVGNPISGHTYSLIPGWAGSSNKTYVDSVQGQMVRQYIHLTRGASNWDFNICVEMGSYSFSVCN